MEDNVVAISRTTAVSAASRCRVRRRGSSRCAGKQLVRAIQEPIENLSHGRAGRTLIKLRDLETSVGKMIERQINPIQLAKIVLAVLQMVQHLKRITERIGEVMEDRTLPMKVEKEAADRRCRAGAIVHEIRPVPITTFLRILFEGGQEIEGMAVADARDSETVSERLRLGKGQKRLIFTEQRPLE